MSLLSGGCSACGPWGLPSSLPQLAAGGKDWQLQLQSSIQLLGVMEECENHQSLLPLPQRQRGVGRLSEVEPCQGCIVPPGRATLEAATSSKPRVGLSLSPQVV